MKQRGRAVLAVLALAAAGACGHPEQRVVDQYFNAVNAKDNQTLVAFAVVDFATVFKTDKRIDKWQVTGDGGEQRVSAPLPDLWQKVQDAEAAVAANRREYMDYFNKYPAEVDQLRELQKKNAAIPAKLQAHATEWEKYTRKEKDLKKAVVDAKEVFEKEKRLVALSLTVPTEEVQKLKGEMVTKTLDVLLTFGGEQKACSMTLRKYDLTAEGGKGKVMHRWIVFALEPKS